MRRPLQRPPPRAALPRPIAETDPGVTSASGRLHTVDGKLWDAVHHGDCRALPKGHRDPVLPQSGTQPYAVRKRRSRGSSAERGGSQGPIRVRVHQAPVGLPGGANS